MSISWCRSAPIVAIEFAIEPVTAIYTAFQKQMIVLDPVADTPRAFQ